MPTYELFFTHILQLFASEVSYDLTALYKSIIIIIIIIIIIRY